MSGFDRLKSDGTATGTAIAAGPAEERVAGEELWWPQAGAAGMVVTERTALKFSALLATLNTVATDVAVLPLCVYQAMPDDSRREAREHPTYELLARTPDGETTPVSWKQAWMGHAMEYGNGYAEIQRRGRGSPYALHLLDPETTRARRAGGRLGYQLGDGRWIQAADVLHVAGFGFDGVTGYSFVRLLQQALGIGMAADTFAGDYFANGSEPGGVIETPNELKDQARRNLRESWEYKHRGPGNRHRLAVLEQGASFKAITTDPEKTQLLETRKFQVLDVIRAWRVPPHKAGDFSEAHLANIEASNLDYLMTALMGWLTTIEQQVNLKLISRSEWLEGYYCEHNVNALLRGDIQARFASYERALRNGWMNRNEVRRRENLDPIPDADGGNLYTVQAQNIPLGDVGKEPPPAPTPNQTPPSGAQNEGEPDGDEADPADQA